MVGNDRPLRDVRPLDKLKARPWISRIVDNKLSIIILDTEFTIELIHTGLILDMYFSYLKPNDKISIGEFRGDYGRYNEWYLKHLLSRKIHAISKYDCFLMFDQLPSDKGRELADIYFRHNNRVVIGEVKTLLLLGTQETAESYSNVFPNGLEDFFGIRCGLKQLAAKCSNFRQISEMDEALNRYNTVQIYPTIIIDHKISNHPAFCRAVEEYWKKNYVRKVIVKANDKIILRRLNVVSQESIFTGPNISSSNFFRKNRPRDFSSREVFYFEDGAIAPSWALDPLRVYTEL